MSRIVHQGMQLCFETNLNETTILKLKVAPLIKSPIQESNQNPKNLPWEGFNFMQNISNTPSPPKEKQSSYIHPSTKTSPRLSQKSLELCTENLGSETGSDDGIDIDILSFNDVVENSTRREIISEEEEKKMSLLKSRTSSKGNLRSFPPPLTSIRSSNSIQCRPHRENGRLVIEAVEFPSRNTYLQAERSNGRLKLSFLNEPIAFGIEMNDEVNEGDFEVDDVIDDYEGGEGHNDGNDDEQHDKKNDVNMEEEIIENEIEVEGRIGIEKLQMLSRCMEGDHGNRNLCNWRSSLWVATS